MHTYIYNYTQTRTYIHNMYQNKTARTMFVTQPELQQITCYEPTMPHQPKGWSMLMFASCLCHLTKSAATVSQL